LNQPYVQAIKGHTHYNCPPKDTDLLLHCPLSPPKQQ